MDFPSSWIFAYSVFSGQRLTILKETTEPSHLPLCLLPLSLPLSLSPPLSLPLSLSPTLSPLSPLPLSMSPPSLSLNVVEQLFRVTGGLKQGAFLISPMFQTNPHSYDLSSPSSQDASPMAPNSIERALDKSNAQYKE